jgi:hypothetical protein
MEVWQSWSIAAVLKTVELKGSVGSNPTASAQIKINLAMSILFRIFVSQLRRKT